MALAAALVAAALLVVVMNPRQVRDFAKATGQLAKTERLDAALLARFGERVPPMPRPWSDEAHGHLEALQRQFPCNSPWLIDDVEQAARLMGTAYHAHGLEANRHAVDTFCEGAFRDGLTRRRVTVDEFFSEFLKA